MSPGLRFGGTALAVDAKMSTAEEMIIQASGLESTIFWRFISGLSYCWSSNPSSLVSLPPAAVICHPNPLFNDASITLIPSPQPFDPQTAILAMGGENPREMELILAKTSIVASNFSDSISQSTEITAITIVMVPLSRGLPSKTATDHRSKRHDKTKSGQHHGRWLRHNWRIRLRSADRRL